MHLGLKGAQHVLCIHWYGVTPWTRHSRTKKAFKLVLRILFPLRGKQSTVTSQVNTSGLARASQPPGYQMEELWPKMRCWALNDVLFHWKVLQFPDWYVHQVQKLGPPWPIQSHKDDFWIRKGRERLHQSWWPLQLQNIQIQGILSSARSGEGC